MIRTHSRPRHALSLPRCLRSFRIVLVLLLLLPGCGLRDLEQWFQDPNVMYAMLAVGLFEQLGLEPQDGLVIIGSVEDDGTVPIRAYFSIFDVALAYNEALSWVFATEDEPFRIMRPVIFSQDEPGTAVETITQGVDDAIASGATRIVILCSSEHPFAEPLKASDLSQRDEVDLAIDWVIEREDAGGCGRMTEVMRSEKVWRRAERVPCPAAAAGTIDARNAARRCRGGRSG